jgi:hypothetical protein
MSMSISVDAGFDFDLTGDVNRGLAERLNGAVV